MNQLSGNDYPSKGTTLTEDEVLYLQSVFVVNCGGTINMAGARERKPAGAVKSQLDAFHAEMEKYDLQIRFIDVFDRPPDSSNMGETEWEIMYKQIAAIIQQKKLILSRCIEQGLEHIPLGGIVVTHGTDTLQISSFVLSLKFALEDTLVPIIFTGSYAPIGNKEGSDAPSNLRNSLLVAKERLGSKENNLPSGVYVLIGQDIHLASRIAKVYSKPNSEGKYFISYPAPVGKVFINKKEFQIKVNQHYLQRVKGAEPLKKEAIRETLGWGIVEHLVIDYFTLPEVLADFQKRALNIYTGTGRRIGLVVQGDFSRNPNFREFKRIFLELNDAKIVTFIGSNNAYQAIQKSKKLDYIGKIHKSLTHGRARVKLSWLLKFNLAEAQIVKLMNTNIVGDIFEAKELPHWIMYETLPDMIERTEIVMIYPNIHHQVIDDTIARIRASESKSRSRGRLYLVGFGDGHIPAPNRSIAQMTEDFLRQEGLIGNDNFKTCENVEELLDMLAQHLQKLDSNFLKNYFDTHYVLQEEVFKSVVYQKIAEEENEEKRAGLAKAIEQTLQGFSYAESDLYEIKNLPSLVQHVNHNVKFSYAAGYLEERLTDYLQQYDSLLGVAIKKYPQLLAERLIKDALTQNHILLNRIGLAVDEGMIVEIKTSVARARTNTDLYEIGNMLKIIGVHSDEVEGWRTTYLTRKIKPVN